MSKIKMYNFYLCLILTCVFVTCKCDDVYHIPLVRHKSMREIALNHVGNLRNSGLGEDVIKLLEKPKPKPTGNDSIALYRYLDSEFYGIVQIGHKAQDFNMVFDTAWADTWVISEDCSYYNPACLVHNRYDHSRSSRYKENGTIFTINEQSYNISGYLSTDDVSIGHTNVSQQTFAEITNLPRIYSLSKADGVIGLGLNSLARSGTPIFYNMIRQGTIKKPIFSIYMNRDKSSNKGGLITLGGIEQRHILGNQTIMYLPIKRTGYWQFKMDRVVMDDGKKSYPFCLQGCQAILDTSSTAIVGPKISMEKLNNIIRAKPIAYNYYRVSCDSIPKLPRLIFTINENDSFVLEGKDYVQQMGYSFLTVCITAFQPLEDAEVTNMWYLGGAFLAKYYSIYNLQDNTIGLVKAA